MICVFPLLPYSLPMCMFETGRSACIDHHCPVHFYPTYSPYSVLQLDIALILGNFGRRHSFNILLCGPVALLNLSSSVFLSIIKGQKKTLLQPSSRPPKTIVILLSLAVRRSMM